MATWNPFESYEAQTVTEKFERGDFGQPTDKKFLRQVFEYTTEVLDLVEDCKTFERGAMWYADDEDLWQMDDGKPGTPLEWIVDTHCKRTKGWGAGLSYLHCLLEALFQHGLPTIQPKSTTPLCTMVNHRYSTYNTYLMPVMILKLMISQKYDLNWEPHLASSLLTVARLESSLWCANFLSQVPHFGGFTSTQVEEMCHQSAWPAFSGDTEEGDYFRILAHRLRKRHYADCWKMIPLLAPLQSVVQEFVCGRERRLDAEMILKVERNSFNNGDDDDNEDEAETGSHHAKSGMENQPGSE
jgi:hypothetical protein